MKRREVITLLFGGAPAALLVTRFPSASLAQDGADWITAFPREPAHVSAWPAGRKEVRGETDLTRELTQLAVEGPSARITSR